MKKKFTSEEIKRREAAKKEIKEANQEFAFHRKRMTQLCKDRGLRVAEAQLRLMQENVKYMPVLSYLTKEEALDAFMTGISDYVNKVNSK